MTRRGFIKRIGGVAVSALAVTAIPVSAIDVKWVSITPMPMDVIESAFGITKPKMLTDTEFRKQVREMIDGYRPLRIAAPLSWK